MKIIIALILFTNVYLATSAQSVTNIDIEESYAIIRDPDGFVNVREEKSAKSAILGKIYRDDVFICFPDKSDWWKVGHLEGNKGNSSNWLEGYMHKSRISLLSNWESVDKRNIYKDSSVFKNDSLVIIVKKAIFNPQKHILTGKSGYVSSIDGKPFWGTDGPMPKQVIKSVTITINGHPIFVPKNAFDDLYEPNLETLSIASISGSVIYISMTNSDGAGGYTVFWIIKDDKFYKRYVDNSDA